MDKIVLDDLQNKVCVITGGTNTLGIALAASLANLHVKVAILDLNNEAVQSAASKIRNITGNVVIGINANVVDDRTLSEAKDKINDELGKIDILINNAGGNHPMATTDVEFMEKSLKKAAEKNFFDLNLNAFQQVFNLNFLGNLLPTIVFSRDMIEKNKGVILNISSVSGITPLTRIPAYSASTSSINNFTSWLAVHLAKMNIRVNAIAQGFFITDQNKYLLFEKDTEKLTERGKKIIKNTPLGKFGDPEDLCGIAACLISDISSFVTGAIIPVDGGFSAYSGV
jgi:NAD(P)-dependent dehydrogenase (short-subunit alcohol dehydrogenase family)